MTLVRSALSVSFFPFMLIGGLAAAVWLHAQGVSDYLIVFSVTFAAAIPTLILQRLMPYEESWRGRPVDYSVDFLHLTLSTAVTASVVRVVVFGVLVIASERVSAWLGFRLWPHWMPLVGQIALSILLGDFVSYWTHRACHTIPFMWRIHVVHHSSERMYALASVRNHPLNVILTYTALNLPLVLMGAPPLILALHAVFNSILGLLQHSNIDLRTGPISWVLSTPELHRLHHSVHMDDSKSNFGTDTAIWDHVFGTRTPPREEYTPVGCPDTRIPVNYIQQLAVPFAYKKFIDDITKGPEI